MRCERYDPAALDVNTEVDPVIAQFQDVQEDLKRIKKQQADEQELMSRLGDAL